MNNKDFLNNLAARLETTPQDIQTIIEAFSKALSEKLEEGDTLAIQNFGSFEIKKKMELLKEQFITFVGLLLSGWAGWLFGRPKQRVELHASELDNVDKAIHIYREMIDDLGEKYAKAIADLKEANLRIKELETSIETLLKQLRK